MSHLITEARSAKEFRAQFIPITEVPNWVPGKGGRPLAVSTVRDWVKNGVNGRRLTAYRIGERLVPTVADLVECIVEEQPKHGPLQKSERRRLDSDAAERLRQHGAL